MYHLAFKIFGTVARNLYILLTLSILSLSLSLFSPKKVEAQSVGRSFYISPNGNNANDGLSPATAWQTIGRASDYTTTYTYGDSILLEGGQTFSGNMYFDEQLPAIPSSTNPITIGSYGAGRAIINSDSPFRGIEFYSRTGIIIENLVIQSSINTERCIHFYSDSPTNATLNFIRIRNVEITGCHAGIEIGSGNGVKYDDIRIINVSSHDNSRRGIVIYGTSANSNTNIYIGYSRFYNNTGTSSSGFWGGIGIVAHQIGNGSIFENNLVYNNGASCALSNCGGGLEIESSANLIIRNNIIHSNKGAAAGTGSGIRLNNSTSNFIIQHNYTYDNDGAAYFLNNSTSGHIVRYNMGYNDSKDSALAEPGSVKINGTASNARIYNNSFYSNLSNRSVISISNTGTFTSNKFYNNLLYATNGAKLIHNYKASGQTVSNNQFQGNLYWTAGSSFQIIWNGTTYSTLSSWQGTPAQERNGANLLGLDVDPLLVIPTTPPELNNATRVRSELNLFRISSNSPAVGTGLNLTTSTYGSLNVGTNDFYGNTIPQNTTYDIGAHEYTVPACASQSLPANQIETCLDLRSGNLGIYSGDSQDDDDLCTLTNIQGGLIDPTVSGLATNFEPCNAADNTLNLSPLTVSTARQTATSTINDIIFEDLRGFSSTSYTLTATLSHFTDGSKSIQLGSNPDNSTSDNAPGAPSGADTGKLFAVINPSTSTFSILQPQPINPSYLDNFQRGSATTVINPTTPVTLLFTTTNVPSSRIDLDNVSLSMRIPAYVLPGNYRATLTQTII